MSNCCHSPGCEGSTGPQPSARYRKALWLALGVNAAMFVVEVGAGMSAGSVSLLADSLDFAGDAANYGLSLAVLSMALSWRSRAAFVKGLSMGAFGLFVLVQAVWSFLAGVSPEPVTMGVVGTVALIANLSVAALLFTYRDGDANMRSVWLCTRNDAVGNLAVLAAAGGVFGTGRAWPDIIVAVIMASLALTACITVVRQSRQELRLHDMASKA